jgi:hypothetical protein
LVTPGKPNSSAADKPAKVEPAEPVRIEPNVPKAAPAGPLKEIAIRVPESSGRNVDVHLVERGGKLTVDVRTANPDLAETLRAHVGDLVTQLDSTGFHTETFRPGDHSLGISGIGETLGQQLTGDQPQSRGNDSNPGGTHHRHTAGQDSHQQQNRRSQDAWSDYFDETINDRAATDGRRF